MGFGIIVFLKSFMPLVFYVVSLLFVGAALLGKVRIALAWTIFLLPLRNVVDKLQGFPLGKDLVDILIIAMIVGWLVESLTKHQKLFNFSFVSVMSIVTIIYIFFALWMGYYYLQYFNFFNWIDPRVQDWKNFSLMPILYLITFNTVRDKTWIWRLFSVMCVTNLAMNYYQVDQIQAFSAIESRTKITGTFQYLGPNEIAAFYAQYTLIFISLFFSMRNSWSRIFMVILILMNVFCVLFLFSRGAYLGFAIGLFFLLLFRKPILLVPFLLLGLSWQAILPEKVLMRINETTSPYGELDASSQNRLIVWKESIEIFKQNALTGAGFAVFRYLGFQLGDTHNIYLKILAEQGMIGFFIFLLLLFAFVKQGITLYQKGDDELSKALGIGFVCCVVALMVNNTVGDRWSYIELSSYLWIIAGFVSRLNLIAREKPKTENAKNSKRQKQKVRKIGLYGNPA